jgi:hypothetical protein
MNNLLDLLVHFNETLSKVVYFILQRSFILVHENK